MNRIGLLGISLAVIACGPPKLGDETGSEDSTTSGDPGEGTTAVATESSETSETGDMSATSTGFVPEGDDTWGDECDPFAQDCPEGEKCVAYASSGGNWDANKCVPIMGDQAPGEPCIWGGIVDATDDCDATGFCWDVVEVDGQLVGTCIPFCTGTPDQPECPPGYTCQLADDGSLTPCIRNCDPLAQDCNDGLACYWVGSNFECVFTTQDIPAGQPCGYINDCAGGLICIAGENLPACADPACCSAFCDLNLGDGSCEAQLSGTVCAAMFAPDEAPAGYEDVGVCLAP